MRGGSVSSLGAADLGLVGYLGLCCVQVDLVAMCCWFFLDCLLPLHHGRCERARAHFARGTDPLVLLSQLLSPFPFSFPLT